MCMCIPIHYYYCCCCCYYYVCLYAPMCAHMHMHETCMMVRGQLAIAGSLLALWVLRKCTWVIRLAPS